YKDFQEGIKHEIEPFHERDKELRAQLEKLRVRHEDPTVSPEEKKDLEEKAKKVQQELEDNSAEVKKALGKKSDDEMRILFTDVFDASRRYAAANGIELVLHYNDAVTPEDFMSPQNIARKLNTGALMPLYAAPGLDISREVVKSLNDLMRKE